MSVFANKLHTLQSQSRILVFPISRVPRLAHSYMCNKCLQNKQMNKWMFHIQSKKSWHYLGKMGWPHQEGHIWAGSQTWEFFERINWNAIGSMWKGFLGKWNCMKIYFQILRWLDPLILNSLITAHRTWRKCIHRLLSAITNICRAPKHAGHSPKCSTVWSYLILTTVIGGRNHEGQMLGNWIKVTWPGINSQISTEIVWIKSLQAYSQALSHL